VRSRRARTAGCHIRGNLERLLPGDPGVAVTVLDAETRASHSLVRVRRGERQCDIYVIGIISELRAAQRASQDAALLGGPLPVHFRVPTTRSPGGG
jgi:hypothetical protein